MAHQPLSKEIHNVKFFTNTLYTGQLDSKGKMSGYGTYTFPCGVEYRGYFKNGNFHGRGVITDKTNFKLCGFFEKGECENYQLFFHDGLEFDENDWIYCSDKDRRFWIEINEGIPPVGKTLLSNERPSRVIPRGCYDTVEGFFNAKTGYIVNAVTGKNIRYVLKNEKKKIEECCRMNEIDFEAKRKLKKYEKEWDMSTDSWVSDDSE